MEIHLDPAYEQRHWAQAAKQNIRRCVHCGFCSATCPTYLLLRDEDDSPRGRIYLIKQLLEGAVANEQTQRHLDRCLTCRNCETTCPSGVKYSQLLEVGRILVERDSDRTLLDRLKRNAITSTLPKPKLLTKLVGLAKPISALLPAKYAASLPIAGKDLSRPESAHARRMLLLEGCAQTALTPETNAAAARVLDRLGISVLAEQPQGCCGAVKLHTSDAEGGLDDIRRRIDAWWPLIDSDDPIEAIISSASGCGVTVKEYGELLAHDAHYADKAKRISSACRDLTEVVLAELQHASEQLMTSKPKRVAVHTPCTLAHGQKLSGKIEAILSALGHELLPVADAHLCCGSAGSYSLLQPKLSSQLKANKLKALQADEPEVVVTANIGCQLHLRGDDAVQLFHWIELVDAGLKA